MDKVQNEFQKREKQEEKNDVSWKYQLRTHYN